ncbi:MAG: hypothetical protein KDC07_06525 [Chitinophagaceae bacterium]|nr:hypothetical protein [Chitinophagaceae bacterium]MCB9045457.1 hypothetical protein [Chitinophagales bacterium]
MNFIWQHIERIIGNYDGSLPLPHFLKNYYKQYPILGSRDRRMLSEMAYCWYRAERWLDATLPIKEKVEAAMRICMSDEKMLERLFPGSTLDAADISTNPEKVFPYDIPLSDGMSKAAWLRSNLLQPQLFIRARKDKKFIMTILQQKHVEASFISDTCITLPNGTAISNWLPEDGYVVQDASSQLTGSYFKPQPNELWWDCCSGAGGKSLLLKDAEPTVKLTVSDTRRSILHNLSKRFKLYHYTPPVSLIADVSDKASLKQSMGGKKFDAIICDVPCSGSGTWARTPEQMFFFKPGSVADFSEKQKKIAVNAAEYLKPGGRLFYITCSVFRQENEDVVTLLQQSGEFTIEEQRLINGIEHHADSMFITVLRKH